LADHCEAVPHARWPLVFPAIECRREDFIKRPVGIPDAPCLGLGAFDLLAALLRGGEGGGGSAQWLGL